MNTSYFEEIKRINSKVRKQDDLFTEQYIYDVNLEKKVHETDKVTRDNTLQWQWKSFHISATRTPLAVKLDIWSYSYLERP